MWTVSDDTLVAGLASGDRDAASAFVRRFQRRVYGLARTIVADDRAAEDIAQEAFVRAWKHAGAYDPRRAASWAGCSPSPATWRSTRCGCGCRSRSIPAALLGYDAASSRAWTRRSWRSWPTTVTVCAPRWAVSPRSSRRAVVLAGLARLHGAARWAEIEDIPLGTAKTRIRTALIRLRAVLVTRSALSDVRALSCAEVRELAPSWRSGILGGAERAEVLLHVNGCARCQAYVCRAHRSRRRHPAARPRGRAAGGIRGRGCCTGSARVSVARAGAGSSSVARPRPRPRSS